MKILFHTPTGTLRPYPRQDDEPVIGLASEYQVYNLVQEDQPAYDPSTHYLIPTETIENQTVTRGWDIVERVVDTVVTRRSFLLALGGSRYAEIVAFIDTISDPEEKYQASVYFGSSLSFARRHPLVLQFSEALNKTEAEVDEIFADAKQLDSSLT